MKRLFSFLMVLVLMIGMLPMTTHAASLTITAQPKNVTANTGTTATFKVAASGSGLKYQWQWRKNASGTWAKATATGNTTATLKVPATAARNGYQYRCKVTDSKGNYVNSKTATLTVKSGPSITTQPKSVTVNAGTTATFKVAASGSGLKYQWQWRKNASGTWAKATAAGNTTATLKVPVTAARNGYQYRCVVTDAKGNKATSNAVTLTVLPPLGISRQPGDVTARAGSYISFAVEATGGMEPYSYQWQYSRDNAADFSDITGQNDAEYDLRVSEDTFTGNYRFRCIITDANGSCVTSDAATVIRKPDPLTITQQPQDVYASEDDTISFTVEVTGGKEPYSYQWQYQKISFVTDSFMSFENMSATDKTLVTKASELAFTYAYRYRCIITDSEGNSVSSNIAKLYDEASAPLSISKQPQNKTAKVGDTVVFTVEATGGREPHFYMWQYTCDGLDDFKNIGTFDHFDDTYTLTVTDSILEKNYQYRCLVRDTDDTIITSNAVTVTEKLDPLVISTQPKNQTGKVGDTVSFTVEVTGGKGPYTYQWWLKAQSGQWVESSTTATCNFEVNAITILQYYAFYCVITDANGNSVTTDTVYLNT